MNEHNIIRRKVAGIAMVEFALLLPFMAAVFFGFVELGRALYQQNSLTKAMTTGARYVARAPAGVTPSCTPGSDWTTATNEARNLIIYPEGADGQELLPGLDDPAAITIAVRAESSGGFISCIIRVQASVPFDPVAAAPLPMLDLTSLSLNASAEERFIGE